MKEWEDHYFEQGNNCYHFFSKAPIWSNQETEFAILVVDYGIRMHYDRQYTDEKTGVITIPTDLEFDKPKTIAFVEFKDTDYPDLVDAIMEDDIKRFREECIKIVESNNDLLETNMNLSRTEKQGKKKSIRESKLSDRQLQDFIHKMRSRKSSPSQETIEESVVHMVDEEHFNPISTAETLKVGDEVYDDKSGHKWRVIAIEPRSDYHRMITFYDTITNKEFIRQVGNLALFEMAVEGDTTYEVDDDLEFEWHPIDDYFNN